MLTPCLVVYRVFSMCKKLHVHLFSYIYQEFHWLFLQMEPKYNDNKYFNNVFMICKHINDFNFPSFMTQISNTILCFILPPTKIRIKITVLNVFQVHFHHKDQLQEYVNIFLMDSSKLLNLYWYQLAFLIFKLVYFLGSPVDLSNQ